VATMLPLKVKMAAISLPDIVIWLLRPRTDNNDNIIEEKSQI